MELTQKEQAKNFQKEFDSLPTATRTGLKKFSYAFVLLFAFPFFLMAIFLVVLGTRLGSITMTQGLVVLLGLLLMIFVSLHKMAGTILRTMLTPQDFKKFKLKKAGGT
ncbi:MAG: hypothetical protein COV47_05985 [Candidatus Diapherotrites archaeon CG11_big_fil_rev_8_21_14_0_20_37_9]|nr:MAG: hypothetical protein COV47_05985 [Candidatus Diapherotrites archaeon CG11_big_fil_rev_8_21_14_0_20_37_9]